MLRFLPIVPVCHRTGTYRQRADGFPVQRLDDGRLREFAAPHLVTDEQAAAPPLPSLPAGWELTVPEMPMASQLYPGRGLNSATGRVFGVGVEYDSLDALNTGQRVIFQLQSVSSTREFAESLSISASAAFKVASWGVSAEFSLASSKEVNSFYTYALIRVVVINPPKTVRNARLKPHALQTLQQQGWDAFAASYGWEYVDGYIDGGSYYALLEIQTASLAEQRSVKTKLSGFYGPFSASGQFEQALKDISSTTAINVSVAQSGGSGDVVEMDYKAMLETARTFPAVAKANPVPILALTADYRGNVPLPPMPAPDSLPRVQQRNTLEDLGREYMRLRDYRANVRFVLSRLADFDEFRTLEAAELAVKRQEFQASAQAVATEIDAIVRRATDCAEDYNKCQTYVPSIALLPLPTIGGDLLNLKQIEEKLSALEQRLTGDQGGSLELGGTSTTPGGGTAYIDFHHGHLAQDFNTRVINDADGQLSLIAGRVHATGDLIMDPGRSILTSGRLHFGGDELLFVLNRSGLIVSKAWGGSGNLNVEGEARVDGNFGVGRDVVLQGRIGVLGQPTTPRTNGWAGGIRTWDIEVEGSAWCRNRWETGPRDLAENYATDGPLQAGDVVSFHPDRDAVRLSQEPNDPMVCGVVSTEPGMLLNAPRSDVPDDSLPIALVGRLPCKVVNENGPIRRGDLLTTSSTPGRAMKAAAVEGHGSRLFASGTLLGKALEDFDGEEGEIEVFVTAR